MDQANPLPGRGRVPSFLVPTPRLSRAVGGRARATTDVVAGVGDADPAPLSEGEARVFVFRAIGAMATLGIGSAQLRELLGLMLRFLPQGALVSGRPWLPMGAGKLARIAGITERTLARRVAELRALGLLERHLDRWNHPARAADGSRCGYDLGPLLEKAAELNRSLDAFFANDTQARREARRSASREAAERARAAVPSPRLRLTRKTGGDDAGVTPIKTIHPDPIGSLVNSLEKGAVGLAEEPPPSHPGPNGKQEGASRTEGAPGPRRAGRLLAALSPDFAMLLRGVARNPDKPSESELLTAADHLARHLGLPRTAWAGVSPSHDRTSLAAIVVLGQAQDASAFRSSRVAWVTAMLRRPGVDPWPSVHRALSQKAQGLAAKPNRFLH